jgi:hypothetical protein
MADFLIHRCTLRVVRRGGWSWGPSPKHVLEQAVRIFPVLLAKKLAELFPGSEERELAAPIRLCISVRFSDFADAVSALVDPPSAGDTPGTSLLDARIEAAIRSAFGVSHAPSPTANRPERAAASPEELSNTFSTPRRKPSGPLHNLLLTWHQQGVLSDRLADFTAPELEAWQAALQRHAFPLPVEEIPESPSLLAALSPFVLSQISLSPHSVRADSLRHRILLATQAAAEFRIPLSHPLVWQTLDRLLPVPAPTVETQIQSARSSPTDLLSSFETIPSPVLPALHPAELPLQDTSAPSLPHSSSEWDVHIPCALPFLLLGPLAPLGYFDLLAAALDAANIPERAHLFAAALAYKVLDPPSRGWLRSPASLAAAAAFAGQSSAIPEDLLSNLSRQLAPHTGPLDRLLTDGVIAGHTTNEPFLLCRADQKSSTGFLLVDTQGCIPLTWGTEPTCFFPLLRRITQPVVLISREATDPALLEAVHNAGITFLLDLPPIRQESWQRVQLGPKTIAWTNHPLPSSPDLLRAALQLAQASEESSTLWQELGLSRISAVHPASLELDRSLTLAAATALGAIAWRLWRKRGRNTPQLVLERFADLDAHIHFAVNSLTVRLPLGRRHQELSEHGFLSPIDDLPWLAGRRVEFTGG